MAFSHQTLYKLGARHGWLENLAEDCLHPSYSKPI